MTTGNAAPASRVRVAVLGAGVRGRDHSRRIRGSGELITAVAEPNDLRRERLAAEHGLPPEACFRDWSSAPLETPGRIPGPRTGRTQSARSGLWRATGRRCVLLGSPAPGGQWRSWSEDASPGELRTGILKFCHFSPSWPHSRSS
jgi:hypothetical protein